jgi:AcrR family transcriptional regulator
MSAKQRNRAAPKGDKRLRTRARLVQVAAELIGQKGLEHASLDTIAKRAGMTRGAIYGNFKDRDELLLAVMEARWPSILPKFEPGASYAQQMRILGEAVIAALPARRTAAVGAVSYQLYALTHERMRARFVRLNAGAYRHAAQELLAFVPEHDLPMPAEAFVRVLHAIIDGLCFLHFLTPELIGEDVIRAAFAVLGNRAGSRS